MATSSAYRFAQQCWRRLEKWPRRILMTVAVLVALVWFAMAWVVLIALVDSPLHCPSTMGCPGGQTTDCSSWGGLMGSATTGGPCGSGH